jgi:hypothetical protein
VQFVGGNSWRVEGDQFIKDDQRTSGVTFGEMKWTVYDLPFGARVSSGGNIRVSAPDGTTLWVGPPDLIEISGSPTTPVVFALPDRLGRVVVELAPAVSVQ